MNPNRKGIKKNKILSADDMILYTENPEDTTHTHTQKLLELINEFQKVARHKINT